MLQKRRKEKKADPFQNRKGRAPSLPKFRVQTEMIAFADFAAPRKPPGFSWPPALWKEARKKRDRGGCCEVGA